MRRGSAPVRSRAAGFDLRVSPGAERDSVVSKGDLCLGLGRPDRVGFDDQPTSTIQKITATRARAIATAGWTELIRTIARKGCARRNRATTQPERRREPAHDTNAPAG